jgi:hypothetical protein
MRPNKNEKKKIGKIFRYCITIHISDEIRPEQNDKAI